MIVGTLRASDLYSVKVRRGRVVHIETFLQDRARIRDVAVGPAGRLYLLLEHASGAKIARIVPARLR